jgi:rhodanese-related sulfurtransferase
MIGEDGMEGIGLNELERLLRDEEAQLVEVLPSSEYEDEHLPGAVNIPLRQLGAEARERLDPSRPVVVYCHDHQ